MSSGPPRRSPCSAPRSRSRWHARHPSATPRADRDRDVEALRALPYVHWSGGADSKLRGVVLHDRARAWSGVNLYTNDRDAAYLMDMDGRRLHTWRLPDTDQQHCEYAELLADGKLAVVCVNDALFVLDARSNVVLEHRAKVHHDVAPLADGGMVVPDKSIHFYRRRMVYFDGLAWLSRRRRDAPPVVDLGRARSTGEAPSAVAARSTGALEQAPLPQLRLLPPQHRRVAARDRARRARPAVSRRQPAAVPAQPGAPAHPRPGHRGRGVELGARRARRPAHADPPRRRSPPRLRQRHRARPLARDRARPGDPHR